MILMYQLKVVVSSLMSGGEARMATVFHQTPHVWPPRGIDPLHLRFCSFVIVASNFLKIHMILTIFFSSMKS